MELTSESDIFFHYTHTIGPAEFQQVMQEAQKLMVDFNSYPAVFLRMVNSCIQTPQTHIAVLLMEPSGAARLDFIQVIELVLCCHVFFMQHTACRLNFIQEWKLCCAVRCSCSMQAGLPIQVFELVLCYAELFMQHTAWNTFNPALDLLS